MSNHMELLNKLIEKGVLRKDKRVSYILAVRCSKGVFYSIFAFIYFSAQIEHPITGAESGSDKGSTR